MKAMKPDVRTLYSWDIVYTFIHISIKYFKPKRIIAWRKSVTFFIKKAHGITHKINLPYPAVNFFQSYGLKSPPKTGQSL